MAHPSAILFHLFQKQRHNIVGERPEMAVPRSPFGLFYKPALKPNRNEST